MRLVIVAVGAHMPAWVDAGFDTYAKRFPRGAPLSLKTVRTAARGRGMNVTTVRATEGEKLLGAAPKNAVIVALDERGANWSSKTLAKRLSDWRMGGRDCAFLIGGPDGLAPTCLSRAEHLWSLSPLTLPHGMVRVIVAEQLYRAQAINDGHPYHRD